MDRILLRMLLLAQQDFPEEKVRSFLEGSISWIVPSSSMDQAKNLLQKQFFHLCLLPLETDSDLEVLSSLKALRFETVFVGMSRRSDPSWIVQCVRRGASQFWVWNPEGTGFREALQEASGSVYKEPSTMEEQFPLADFVGRHPKIQEVFHQIQSLKDSDATVLITGESGTGKEVVARAIHALSQRRRSPWVAVNCSAIPSNLLESELFGHVKGAFTGATHTRIGRFQMAGSGTLFLDEIADLPIDLQAKILRAIQQRVYEPVGSTQSLRLEARVIAATNQELEKAVAEKRFREDLYYRLNVIPIILPPLRSRRSDIPLLTKFFLDRFLERTQKKITGISQEAMELLMQYHWPGNIRELENVMERVVVLKRNPGLLEVSDFPVDYFRNVRLDRFVSNVALPESGVDFNTAVDQFENELILQALKKTLGNKNKAASLLNLNRTTLVEKLKRKGLCVT